MKNYISTTEAAKILKVSHVTIFNMIQDGRIKGVKVGRNYIIDRDELQENFIKDYKKKILPILKKHDVAKASIFGSLLRGKKNPNDLDLLIEYKKNKNKSLLDFVGLKLELEEKLGIKVDLGHFHTLHRMIKDHVIKESVPIL